MCRLCRIVYFILLIYVTGHPNMSCAGVNPKAAFGATSHHVLESGFNTVASRPFGASTTGVVACSVCPAIFLVAGPALVIGDVGEGVAAPIRIAAGVGVTTVAIIVDLILEVFYRLDQFFNVGFD